jgi:hypothetical protein
VRRATIGDDDLQLLAFLAEQRVATAWHMRALLGCSPQTTERRVHALVAAGVAGRQTIFAHEPAMCWITQRGLRTIGSPLPAPKPNLERYRHDLGVAWLWLAARGGAFGRLRGQVSERAMRSADRRGRSLDADPPVVAAARMTEATAASGAYGIGIGGAGPRGGVQLHYPDLLLQTASGHRVAVELELSGKGRRRLERIMLGYAADARVDAALYLCPPGPLGARVQEAARRVGIGERVHVQRLTPGSPAGAPSPGVAISAPSAALSVPAAAAAVRDSRPAKARSATAER